jgi:hypothetical protein
MTPARLRLGLAYVWERGWASVEGELLPPLSGGFLPRELTWNVRAGARAMVADHAAIGGGLFTDRKGPEDPVLGTPGAVGEVDFVDLRDASVHEIALHLGSTLTF